jgi:multiple sugar transport system permease protein
MCYIILNPFFAKISSSFKSIEDFMDVTVKYIPKHFTLDTYKAIILENNYLESVLTTAMLAVVCALLQTFICSFVGYGFAKYKFKGSGFLFTTVLVTMMVPPQTIKYALFLQFKNFDILGIFKLLGGGVFEGFKVTNFTSLNLLNSYWPLALLSIGGLAFKNGLYIFMMRQFFRGVPDELEESAYIDGSGVFRTFVQIILPLSIPMMITIFLFAFSWQWTDNFYTGLFFVGEKIKLMPSIVKVPRMMEDAAFAGWDLYASAIRNTCGLLVIAPLVVVYLFCQRYLIQGIERSGIVG